MRHKQVSEAGEVAVTVANGSTVQISCSAQGHHDTLPSAHHHVVHVSRASVAGSQAQHVNRAKFPKVASLQIMQRVQEALGDATKTSSNRNVEGQLYYDIEVEAPVSLLWTRLPARLPVYHVAGRLSNPLLMSRQSFRLAPSSLAPQLAAEAGVPATAGISTHRRCGALGSSLLASPCCAFHVSCVRFPPALPEPPLLQ